MKTLKVKSGSDHPSTLRLDDDSQESWLYKLGGQCVDNDDTCSQARTFKLRLSLYIIRDDRGENYFSFVWRGAALSGKRK